LLQSNLPKLGAVLGALVFAIPGTALAADPSPGGLSFSDPDAPTVFADGSTLTAPLGQLVGGDVSVTGVVAGTEPGDAVVVQRLDAASGGWVTVATTVVGADGSYSASWKADHAEKTTVRAVPASQATTATRSASGAAPVAGASAEGRALTLYRRAKVTWYGPGFYGRKTACGTRLRKATLGVANKSLPCGTLVDLYNNGQTVTVPVIDRGPFRAGTSYDLTAATAKAIGVTTTTTIGAVRSAPVVSTAPAPAPAPATPAPAVG
jgi:rare lipoprotein A